MPPNAGRGTTAQEMVGLASRRKVDVVRSVLRKEIDQAGVGALETARAQVEGGEFRVKVNVQPLAARCPRMLHGEGDDRRSDA